MMFPNLSVGVIHSFFQHKLLLDSYKAFCGTTKIRPSSDLPNEKLPNWRHVFFPTASLQTVIFPTQFSRPTIFQTIVKACNFPDFFQTFILIFITSLFQFREKTETAMRDA